MSLRVVFFADFQPQVEQLLMEAVNAVSSPL